MGLVKLLGADSELYIRPDDVTAIAWGTMDKDCTAVHIRGESEPWLVKGTPDEVHAALFPTPHVRATVIRDAHIIPKADLAKALDPATYEEEWQNHSPQCVRAMTFALGLVRARLGVGR